MCTFFFLKYNVGDESCTQLQTTYKQSGEATRNKILDLSNKVNAHMHVADHYRLRFIGRKKEDYAIRSYQLVSKLRLSGVTIYPGAKA